ncbi:methyltransferase domain-containing protein [Magnetospirillum molischianum]|uniref:SAM-dependent methyltransferase n=1 Tax=Magnetospirillum molischianum DSM 120 TaxID=1150626 RepID=H8FSG7_MAGML|nr:methyltransferase domain-containing protein [Magnetospirillum molischianum]CCG41305.1 SAM-dependent methyltransferase [Magnetospirillum molischianum DSM 120]
MTSRKQRIQDSFSAAASGYESAAGFQDRIAAGLAARLAALPSLPDGARVLEVGCGTGLLTRRLRAAVGEQADILATDLSPAMVAHARDALAADRRIAFAAMDAEAPTMAQQSLDLIVSSLAAQWFSDLPTALADLAQRLAPGGRLILTLPGAGSFAEWRAAHRALGLEPGTPAFPDATALWAMMPPDGDSRIDSETVVETHRDGLAFARTLAALGAAVPRPGHRPLAPGQLRRVIAALGAPCTMTWTIHTLSFTRNGIQS